MKAKLKTVPLLKAKVVWKENLKASIKDSVIIEWHTKIYIEDWYIKWKVKWYEEEQTLISLSELKWKDGKDGKSIKWEDWYTPKKWIDYFDGKNGKDWQAAQELELKNDWKNIVWKREKEKEWKQLISLEDIKGKVEQILIWWSSYWKANLTGGNNFTGDQIVTGNVQASVLNLRNSNNGIRVDSDNANVMEFVMNNSVMGLFQRIDSSSSQFRFPQYSTWNTADNYPAYSFSQDPDTGMLLFADGKLGFATGADTKMLIDDSNVGIGKVTGISSTLDVNGSFALPIRTSAVNTTLTSSDYTVILTSPSRVVTLPSPVLNRIYVVSNRSNGVCSITGNIDSTVQTITIPAYESYQLQATSTTWYVNSSNSAKLYSQSRGLSLVTNGTGLLGTNENFSSLTYDPIEVYSGRASFKTSIANTTFVSNELIPVDLNKKYRLTVYAKSTTYVAGNKAYFGIQPTDIDWLLVAPQNYKRFSWTDTTLASELKAGDTTITLTSASGWQTSNANAYNRQAIFWNYSNSQGYQYPAYTYSRNNTALNYGGSYSTAGLWAVGWITGNVITLTSAWTGATIPAGTPVSNASSSGTYKYIAASNLEVPNTWTKFSGCIQGIDEEGLASNVRFPYGTAFVQIIGLLNRDVTGNVTNISNISFQEDVDSGDMRIINQTGTHYVDFLNDNYVDMTLTGNTTLLKGTTPNKNITEVVKYIIRGSFTLSFWPEFSATYPISWTYNGAKDNLVTLTCMNINGTLKYKATIEN